VKAFLLSMFMEAHLFTLFAIWSTGKKKRLGGRTRHVMDTTGTKD
jgi:hypothetical protein